MDQPAPQPLPRPQPGIMEIKLYEGGAGSIDGVRDAIKLSSNENPHGPGPGAIEAVRASAESLHLYPSTSHDSLRAAIGDVAGLDPVQIICGVGSDEIISLLCQCYVGPGDETIHTEHGFSMYRISTLAAGGKPVSAPERDRTVDVDAILDRVTARTRLVFVANPNNPTGTMASGGEMARLADGLPGNVVLAIDGAYAEYVGGYDGGASLVEGRPNVVMTRTFSKIHGLGGLRVGWGYGPREVIGALDRIRGPFNLSRTALAAAEASIRDQGRVEWCRAENERLRERLREELAAAGVATDRSFANFLLARFEDEPEAAAADAHLKSRGLIARRVSDYGFPQALRITIGDEAACNRVAAAIREFRDGRGR